LSETIATFVQTSRFRSVDFPAFGRPTIATKPERGMDVSGDLVTIVAPGEVARPS
jgi:hypothetical protein